MVWKCFLHFNLYIGSIWNESANFFSVFLIFWIYPALALAVRRNFYLAENSFPSHWDPPTSITPVMKIIKIMKKIMMIIKMTITLIVILVIISDLGFSHLAQCWSFANILLSSVKLWAGLFNFGRILISFSLPLHNFDAFADVNQFHPNLDWPCRSGTAFPEIFLLYLYKFEISQIFKLHSLPPKCATKVTEFRTNVVPRLS